MINFQRFDNTLKEELGTIRMLGSPEIQNLPEQQTEFLNKCYPAIYLREYRDENLAEEEWQKRQKHHAAQRAQVIIEFIHCGTP
jgi:hypothetical protein